MGRSIACALLIIRYGNGSAFASLRRTRGNAPISQNFARSTELTEVSA
jgi:hypothetical protein